jgi:aldose 1-epimerase
MKYFLFLATIFLLTNCSSDKKQQESLKNQIQKQDWGKLPDGRQVSLYTLKNKNGMELKISDYGGIITHWTAPDRSGKYEDITLGYDSLDGYLKETPYFGALIGRYGNRIAKGKFSLEDKDYTLATNNGANTLHGGKQGFDKVLWSATVLEDRNGLELKYLSKDGEEGYPGNLNVTVRYVLEEDNTLHIEYEATTDATTVVNLTNHAYFNLTASREDILKHQVMLNCDTFLPVDAGLIPTSELRKVENSPFDFRKAKAIGQEINQTDNEQIKLGGGYDHCWIVNTKDIQDDLKLVAQVLEPTSGRLLTVKSTEPGVQFYSGNFLDGSIKGKQNTLYNKRFGFCLETQHFPDSPNQPSFPTTVLKKGEVLKSKTTYSFSVK